MCNGITVKDISATCSLMLQSYLDIQRPFKEYSLRHIVEMTGVVQIMVNVLHMCMNTDW